MTEGFADYAAGMEAELNHLRSKSDHDDEMIALMKRQLETQSMDIAKMVNDHTEEIRILRQRCDLAVRREKEISGILNTAAGGIMSGLRKMKGDDTPPKLPANRGGHVDHALLPVNEPPSAEPASVRRQVPREVEAFAPRHGPRPTYEGDGLEDGLRQVVDGIHSVNSRGAR